MSERINLICDKEGVTLGPDVMATLGTVSGGDLRRAITTLQSAVRLAGPAVSRCAVVVCGGAVGALPGGGRSRWAAMGCRREMEVAEGGDLRRAITTLQSAVRSAGPAVSRCAVVVCVGGVVRRRRLGQLGCGAVCRS